MGLTPRTVCLFTDTEGFGGAEQALLTLAAGLDRRAWQPVLCCHPTPAIEPLLAGARALAMPVWPVPRMPEGRVGARRLLPFARWLRRQRPAVFHAHLVWPLACKFGLMAAILARLPAIVATEQVFVQYPLDASNQVQQRLIMSGVGRYLAVSRDLAERLRQWLHIPAGKLQVVHNSINLEDYRRPADAVLRASLSGPHGRPVILTVARLDQQKGLGYLLETAAQVPEAQFVLAGDGPEREALQAQAAALEISDRVTFLGYRADIADLLACCDLFVLPSLFEGLPLSVLEAMAASRPVIATAIGGTDEAVSAGETGLLVPPANAARLAQAIHSLLADRPYAQRLAAAGHQRAREAFSAEQMVTQVSAVYTQLLAHRNAR